MLPYPPTPLTEELADEVGETAPVMSDEVEATKPGIDPATTGTVTFVPGEATEVTGVRG